MEVAQHNSADMVAQETEGPVRKNLFQLILDWPLRRKLAAGAVVVISMALFTVLIIQARVADQQLLYANLTENDAASVVSWLKAQRIPYTLKNGGKNIWVSADAIYETRLSLAANGLPSGGGVGFEVFDNQSFALTDYVQKVNYTRALQGELARTITSLAPVESTRVHLALPEKRLFKNQQKTATASVIVTLVQGRVLDNDQVGGIIHLVAGSVSGLEADNVKVIDSNGMVLKSEETAKHDKMLSVDMLAFQQEVEHRLELRAQDLLDKTMGEDKAMVRVTATLDFSKVEKTEELFDSEEPVIRSEQVNQESSGNQTIGGIPGVQSNLEGNTAGNSSTFPPTNKNSRITNYEISKTISKIVNPVGTISNLSVSVLVADKTVEGAEGKTTVVQRSPEELESIKEMVSAALGIIEQRGDHINILSMPFIDKPATALEEQPGPATSIYQYIPLIKIGLIFVGLILLYLFLIRPLVKTMRSEVTAHYKTVEQLEQEQQAQLAMDEEPSGPLLTVDESLLTLRREVQHNQAPAAYIIKNWIQEG